MDLTSCRGLAIVQASPRLIYAEGSLEKRRGLGILLESKEKLSKIEGEVLNNQKGEAAKGKREEASAKPKRTVAGEGEKGEKGRSFGKTEAHSGWRGKEDGRFELCSFLPDALDVFQSERTRECNEGEGRLISICTEKHKR